VSKRRSNLLFGEGLGRAVRRDRIEVAVEAGVAGK
jgi:hypothetical protein